MTLGTSEVAKVTPAAEVRLSRNGLEVLWVPEKETVTPDDGMLGRFLASARDLHDVLDFIRSYGGLALCKHGLPATHNRPALGEDPCTAWPKGKWFHEPIDTWQRYAREGSALLDLVDKIVNGDESKPDFDAVCEPFGLHDFVNDLVPTEKDTDTDPPGGPYKPKNDDQEASSVFLLDWLTDRWLKLGNVTIHFSYVGHHVNPRLVGDGTFGALALQLTEEVTRRLDHRHMFVLAQCNECGKTYQPTRRPRADRGNYCPDCGRAAASKNAQRRYRDRQRKDSR